LKKYYFLPGFVGQLKAFLMLSSQICAIIFLFIWYTTTPAVLENTPKKKCTPVPERRKEMKTSKRILTGLLAVLLLASLCTAFAADDDKTRAVIGADLTDDQIASVYSTFGVKRGDVKEMTITNADEREYLDGYVDDSLIGTKSISCVYIKVLDDGSGLDVTTNNITWCAPEMYVNALATAGITDAKVIVAAPFQVSGTAALTGVYKAYEDITGQKLDENAKLAGTQELAVTSDLANEIGSKDSTAIVSDLKEILGETVKMSDDELRQKIAEIAKENNTTLSDKQTDQLVSLCRSMEKMDASQLLERVNEAKQTLKKMADAKTKAVGFIAKVQQVVTSIADFFQSLVAHFKK
jgi:uncharacterized protein YpuA (DUF1002 family)